MLLGKLASAQPLEQHFEYLNIVKYFQIFEHTCAGMFDAYLVILYSYVLCTATLSLLLKHSTHVIVYAHDKSRNGSRSPSDAVSVAEFSDKENNDSQGNILSKVREATGERMFAITRRLTR